MPIGKDQLAQVHETSQIQIYRSMPGFTNRYIIMTGFTNRYIIMTGGKRASDTGHKAL